MSTIEQDAAADATATTLALTAVFLLGLNIAGQ
jgi:hypothetical protein